MRAVVTGAWFKDADGVLHESGAEVDVDAKRFEQEFEPNGVLSKPEPKATAKADEGEGEKKKPSPSKPKAPRKTSSSDDE